MAVEQFVNLAQTTLNGSINNSVSSLVVASASGFPTAGNFRLVIDNELLLVTSVAGTTFTVTRGIEGTAAASHASGATVTAILTAGALALFRPALYPITDPSLPSFAWVNQGSATETVQGATRYLSVPGVSGDNWVMRTIAIPAAPYTLTAAFRPFPFPGSVNAEAGLVLYDSVSGKFVVMAFYGANPGRRIFTAKFTNFTTFSATYRDAPFDGTSDLLWFRIVDDGTNRAFWLSIDGNNWTSITTSTISNTDFVTPNFIGFGANGGNNTFQVSMLLLSWLITQP